MNIEKFVAEGREVVLYISEGRDAPLIVLNNYSGDGSSVIRELKALGAGDLNLLCVGNLKWDHDMTPWYCPPLSPQDTPCTGGAEHYREFGMDVVWELNPGNHFKDAVKRSAKGIFAIL